MIRLVAALQRYADNPSIYNSPPQNIKTVPLYLKQGVRSIDLMLISGNFGNCYRTGKFPHPTGGRYRRKCPRMLSSNPASWSPW